ncbi:MAG: DUF5947 family protein [Thermoleophilaceae bacterium]
MSTPLASSRLRRMASTPAPVPAPEEKCELCGEPIAPEHRHLLDLENRELMCACRACGVLFDRRAAGGGHYRLVSERRLHLPDFELRDEQWDELRIPVDMAFFFHHSGEGRVVAFYPGPMGATESLLDLRAWRSLEAANPVLEGLEPDVEALLVNRSRGARDHWLVPIDECYGLAGLIRAKWRGLTGGKEVWQQIESFFGSLTDRSKQWTT